MQPHRPLIAALLAATIAITGTPTALASELTESVNQVADEVDEPTKPLSPLPVPAAIDKSPTSSGQNMEFEELVASATPADQANAVVPVTETRTDAIAEADGTQVLIPLDGPRTVEISDTSGTSVIDVLPGVSLSSGEVLEGGSVLFDAADGTSLIVQALEDSSTRLAIVITESQQPATFTFSMVPDGGYVEEVDGGLLIFAADGTLDGGVLPPWARDAAGTTVPTRYEVRGHDIIQIVDHQSDYLYPIVADPLFARGIIKRVNKEVWNRSKGGYELQAEVTALARWVWAAGRTDIVMVEGYRDLVEHYPRSMKAATMRQQWDCHAVGLIATKKIDLEGWRPSKPNWRKTEIWAGIWEAIRRVDPTRIARACNW